MSQPVQLFSKNLPGYRPYGTSEGRRVPNSGVSGRLVTISPCSFDGDYRVFSEVKIVSMKRASGTTSFVCKASSGGHRRNSDFSRQNRQGFSRNRNRQNEERDSFENFDDSDLLASKDGPLLSLSGTPKSQATAAPGKREKEIVELFRKVQAQLRAKAAVKEDKKVEASQGKGRDSETVDSLLKLLRKHSIDQGKEKTNSPSSEESSSDQPQQDGPYNEAKSRNFFNSNNKERNDILESNASTFWRPPSSFRRKSPIPQVKFQPVYQSGDSVNSTPHLSASSQKKKDFELPSNPVELSVSEPELEPEEELESELEPETETEAEAEAEPSFTNGVAFDELSEDENVDDDADKQQQIGHEDLGSLKLAELRALAKSRGVKGFSKMKKGELVEFLSGGSA